MPATITAREMEETYVAAFAAKAAQLPGDAAWRGLRSTAIARFAELGFPTTHDEDWKYTNLAPFLKAPYERVVPAHDGKAAELLRDAKLADLGCPRLVFVNGRFAPQLSATGGLAAGVTWKSLREAAADGSARGLATRARFERNALAALNTAAFEDGAFVRVARGAVPGQPVHIVHVAAGAVRSVAYPRTLVVAGRDSQLEVVESYIGPDGAAYFTNAVTEVVAEDGAVLDHYKIQTEGSQALHYGLLAVEQGASSNVTSHNIALGAALARNEIAAVLNGEGAECLLNGLYLTTGRQHVDNHTTLEHAKPHTTSHELYKGILDGHSQAVFHGRILVRPEAQKTDAIQRNKNLLLSEGAVINTKPQLEIYADDVKCTHGATVGQVDQDAVFYLRSRGIPLAEARSLLVYAFTAELIDRIKIEPVRERLAASLFARLAGGQGK